MHSFFIAVVSVAGVLGVLVVIHELGHYAMAKLLGVRVEVFSIGFGKRLIGFRRGDTDYRISAIPLGGYVKMSGENPMEQRSGDPAEFMSHPRWQRFIIAFAGPFMNIVLAIGVLTGVYMVRYEKPVYLDEPAVIGWVLEGSVADKAGIQAGDRILRVETKQNPTWEDLETEVLLNPGQPLPLAVQRGNEILDKTITPEKTGPNEVGADPGWAPVERATVHSLDAGLPAAKAGIQLGDEIVALNGKPTRNMSAIKYFLQQNKSVPVEVTVLRNGQTLNLTMSPVETQVDGQKMYRIGIGHKEPVRALKLSFPQAFAKSIEQNKRFSVLIIDLVGRLVQRKVSMKQIDGPIGIAGAAGQAAQAQGWAPLLELTAMISLNLGIFNLFPIPIMDGGVILLLFIEGLMRRDISIKIKERIYQAAFVFLLLFAAMVIYNDLGKLPLLSRYLP
ncbi:MAG: RIP metalloprotease RseP [Acidobacteriia bacterium]|nr:RIP metalloprotease RseP [Terriglobia bacterium]